MLRLRNFTPHNINIFAKEDVFYDEKQRKYFIKEGAKPLLVLPSEGILNAHIDYELSENVDGIDIFEARVKNIDPLPSGRLIVSALFVTACKILGINTNRLLTISQPVYSNPDNPRPVGCLGLNKA